MAPLYLTVLPETQPALRVVRATFITGRSLDALGVAPAQLVGRSIRDATRKQPEIVAYVEAALAGEAFTAIVDSQEHSFETRYAPYSDENGSIAGVVGVALDVTERTQLQERLVELRQQAGADAQGALVDQRTVDLPPDDLVVLCLLAEGQTKPSIRAIAGPATWRLVRSLVGVAA